MYSHFYFWRRSPVKISLNVTYTHVLKEIPTFDKNQLILKIIVLILWYNSHEVQTQFNNLGNVTFKLTYAP